MTSASSNLPPDTEDSWERAEQVYWEKPTEKDPDFVWYQSPKGCRHAAPACVFVFLHGILSNSDCWRREHAPALVRELQLLPHSVFLQYESRPFNQGGNVQAADSLAKVLSGLADKLRTESPDRVLQFYFICHSNGGLVLNRFLQKYGREYFREVAEGKSLGELRSVLPLTRLITFVCVPERGGQGMFGELATLLHQFQRVAYAIRPLGKTMQVLTRLLVPSTLVSKLGVNAITEDLRTSNQAAAMLAELESFLPQAEKSMIPFPSVGIRMIAPRDNIAKVKESSRKDGTRATSTHHFLTKDSVPVHCQSVWAMRDRFIDSTVPTSQYLLVRQNSVLNKALGFRELTDSAASGVTLQKQALDRIEAFLKKPDGHILVLSGPAQAGKSRLMAWAARRRAVEYLNHATLHEAMAAVESKPAGLFVPLSFIRFGPETVPKDLSAAEFGNLILKEWIRWADSMCGGNGSVRLDTMLAFMKTHPTVLFLDSLDEFLLNMPGLGRGFAVQVVVALKEQFFPKARIIVAFRSEPESVGVRTLFSRFREAGAETVALDLLPESDERIRDVIGALRQVSVHGARIEDFLEVIRTPFAAERLKGVSWIKDPLVKRNGLGGFLLLVLRQAFAATPLDGTTKSAAAFQADLSRRLGLDTDVVDDALALLGFLGFMESEGNRYFLKLDIRGTLERHDAALATTPRLAAAAGLLRRLLPLPNEAQLPPECGIARVYRDAFTELGPSDLICTHSVWMDLLTAQFYSLTIRLENLEFIGQVAFSPVITGLAGDLLDDWHQRGQLVRAAWARAEEEANPLYLLNMIALYGWSRQPRSEVDAISHWFDVVRSSLPRPAWRFVALFALNALVFRWKRSKDEMTSLDVENARVAAGDEHKRLDEGLKQLVAGGAQESNGFIELILALQASVIKSPRASTLPSGDVIEEACSQEAVPGRRWVLFDWSFGGPPESAAEWLRGRSLQAALVFLVRMVERGLPDGCPLEDRQMASLRLPTFLPYVTALIDAQAMRVASREVDSLLHRLKSNPDLVRQVSRLVSDPTLSDLLGHAIQSMQSRIGRRHPDAD